MAPGPAADRPGEQLHDQEARHEQYREGEHRRRGRLVWKLLIEPVHSCVWNSFSMAIATIQASSEITSWTKPRTKPTAAPPISNRKTKTSSAVTSAALA